MTSQTGRAAEWKTIEVFISSTFRDMDAERDALRDVVFPELSARLRERRCDLAAIDLRWGVDTTQFEAQAQKETEVLSVCLREIERSRPYFVALMGDRYGWVPPRERSVDAVRAAGRDTNVTGWSVTRLEIEQGVFGESDPAGGSVALLRNPLPYMEMPADVAARFSDRHASDVEGPGRANDLASLRQRVLDRLGTRADTYDAGWDGTRVVELEEFTRLAIRLLWDMLDAATRDRLSAVPQSWIDRERLAIEAHCRERRRDMLGRDPLVAALVAHCTGADGDVQASLIVGESGIGKSAVLASVAAELRGMDIRVLHHIAGVTSNSTSSRAALFRWCEMLDNASVSDDGHLHDLTPTRDLVARFEALLATAANDQRTVVIIDAIDEFADGPQGRRLSWLPDLPSNVRVVAAATPGDDADAISDRRGWQRVALGPLDQQTSGRVVDAFARRRARTLPSAVREQLVGHSTRSPLWLRGAVHDLLELGAEEYRRLETLDGSADERLDRLLIEHTADLPNDVPGLYREIFARAERLYEFGFLRGVLGLLAVSREGLRESDLAGLTGRGWKPLQFARLRRQLDPHLVQRAEGRWDFTHRQARAAAIGLLDERRRIEAHHAIAKHLAALPNDDPVAGSELVYHRVAAGDHHALIQLVAEPTSEATRSSIAPTLATHLIGLASIDPDHASNWVSDVLTTAHVEPLDRRCIAARIAAAVEVDLDGRLELTTRIVLFDSLLAKLTRPDLFDLETKTVSLVIHTSLHRGLLLAERSNLGAARVAFEHALAIARRADAASSIVIDFECTACGAVLARDEQFATIAPAISKHLRACGLRSTAALIDSLAEFGGDTDRGRDMAHALTKLGLICEHQGDYEQARVHLAEAARLHRAIVEIYLEQMMGIVTGEFEHRADLLIEARSDPELLWAVQSACDCLCRLGELENRCGNDDEAMQHLSSASDIATRAVAQLGEKIETTLMVAHVELSTAEVGTDLWKPADSHRRLKALAPALINAHREAPTNVGVQQSLLRCYQHLLWAAVQVGDVASVRDAVAQMQAIARNVQRQGLDSAWVADLGSTTETALANIDEMLGRHEDAFHRYRNVASALSRRAQTDASAYAYESKRLDLLFLTTRAAHNADLGQEAEYNCRQVIKLGDELLQRQPSDARVAQQLGAAYGMLGSIELWSGDLDGAETHLSLAATRLRDTGPVGLAWLVQALSEIGALHGMRGHPHEAKLALAEAGRTLASARSDGHGGAEVLRILGTIEDRLGVVEEHQLGSPTTAIDHYRRSLEARLDHHKLVVTDHTAWQIVGSYGRLANAHSSLGDADTQREYLESATGLVSELTDVASPWHLRSIGVQASNSLGEILAVDRDFERAISMFELALQQLDRTDPNSAPEADLRWARARSQEGIGQCARILGRTSEARASLLGATESWRALTEDAVSAEAAVTSLLINLEHLAKVSEGIELDDVRSEAVTLLHLIDEHDWVRSPDVIQIATDLETRSHPWTR